MLCIVVLSANIGSDVGFLCCVVLAAPPTTKYEEKGDRIRFFRLGSHRRRKDLDPSWPSVAHLVFAFFVQGEKRKPAGGCWRVDVMVVAVDRLFRGMHRRSRRGRPSDGIIPKSITNRKSHVRDDWWSHSIWLRSDNMTEITSLNIFVCSDTLFWQHPNLDTLLFIIVTPKFWISFGYV